MLNCPVTLCGHQYRKEIIDSFSLCDIIFAFPIMITVNKQVLNSTFHVGYTL